LDKATHKIMPVKLLNSGLFYNIGGLKNG